VAGPIAAENSVRGATAGGGGSMIWAYGLVDPIPRLIVGRPADNIVTIFIVPPLHTVFLPIVAKSTR
jgi:hypothetical protein